MYVATSDRRTGQRGREELRRRRRRPFSGEGAAGLRRGAGYGRSCVSGDGTVFSRGAARLPEGLRAHFEEVTREDAHGISQKGGAAGTR